MNRAARPPDPELIARQVREALAEDLGQGDISSELLVPEQAESQARLISREPAVLCGQAWFDACFRQLDPNVQLHWQARDSDAIAADTTLCRLRGRSRALLGAERTALNFLQTLSGTATVVAHHAARLQGLALQLLDTRKTLPGLRLAQKYAVRCGGAHNHRCGLHDAILIKENHLLATGQGVGEAVRRARKTDQAVTVEVEDLEQLNEALEAGAEHVLLDNFTGQDLREAVRINARRAVLEASGNITDQDLAQLADCGVARVSLGRLTKDLRAIDFSLRFIP